MVAKDNVEKDEKAEAPGAAPAAAVPEEASDAKAAPSVEAVKPDQAAEKPEVTGTNESPVDVAGKSVTAATDGKQDDMQERLTARAKRFGIAVSAQEDEKKLDRAKRFGVQTSQSEEANKPSRAKRCGTSGGPVATGAELEKIKARAERFGTAVPTPMADTAEEDRKNQRAKRFAGIGGLSKDAPSGTGGVVKAAAAASAAETSTEVAEKKRKRAERFTAAGGTEPAGGPDGDSQKKKQRAERFGAGEVGTGTSPGASAADEEKKELRAKRFAQSEKPATPEAAQ